MADPVQVRTARVVQRGAGLVTPLQGLNALNEIVAAARECVVVHQVERSKRQQIRAHQTIEVARIKAAESVLKVYFAQVFAERRSNFEELFNRLDNALDVQDGETVNVVLRGIVDIVDIAKSSPIADLGDLSQIRAALSDPDHVWDL